MAALLDSFIECPIALSSVAISISGADPDPFGGGPTHPSTWSYGETFSRVTLAELHISMPSNWLGFSQQLGLGTPGVVDSFIFEDDGLGALSEIHAFILDHLSPGQFLLLCQRSTPGIPITLGRSTDVHLASAWYNEGFTPPAYADWTGRAGFRFVANRAGLDWPTQDGSAPSIRFELSMAQFSPLHGESIPDFFGTFDQGAYAGRIDPKHNEEGVGFVFDDPQTYNCALAGLNFHTAWNSSLFPGGEDPGPSITTDVSCG